MHILSAYWSHKWIFWPTAILAYVGIGTVIGLVLYWKFCRHQYTEHGWRGGDFPDSNCWCCNSEICPLTYLGFISAPVLWPLVMAALTVYTFVIAPIVIVVKILTRLYAAVETVASWDGRTIENAHPSARKVEDNHE